MDQSCHQMDCQALSRNIIHVFMDVNEHKLCWMMYMVYAFYSGIQCIKVLNFQIIFVKLLFFLNMLSYCVYLKYENHMNNWQKTTRNLEIYKKFFIMWKYKLVWWSNNFRIPVLTENIIICLLVKVLLFNTLLSTIWVEGK
jgi:hypothetical protein